MYPTNDIRVTVHDCVFGDVYPICINAQIKQLFNEKTLCCPDIENSTALHKIEMFDDVDCH
jgi:hypothetical protein